MPLKFLVIGRGARDRSEVANGHLLDFARSAREGQSIVDVTQYHFVLQHLSNAETNDAIAAWTDRKCEAKVIGFSAGQVPQEWRSRSFPTIGGLGLPSRILKLPWAEVPRDFSGNAAALIEILAPRDRETLLTIDKARAWAKWFPDLRHVDLSIRHDGRRCAQARPCDVLLIHTQDGCRGDRATLGQLPADERPLVILVTGGSAGALPVEWSDFVREYGADVVEYVPHFRGGDDGDTIRSYVNLVRQIIQQPHGVSSTVVQDGEMPWIRLARRDVHQFKNKIILNSIDRATLHEFLDGEHSEGGSWWNWFVRRRKEIQDMWQFALESREIENNATNREAKDVFDQSAEAFVCLVQNLSSDVGNPCDLRKAAEQMWEAIDTAFLV